MDSSNLIAELKKSGVSQYKLARLIDVEDTTISSIKARRRHFTADQLSVLVQKKVITKMTALKVKFFDSLNDQSNWGHMASMAIAAPLLTSIVREICILCKIPIVIES